jgi:hypothetical protein
VLQGALAVLVLPIVAAVLARPAAVTPVRARHVAAVLAVQEITLPLLAAVSKHAIHPQPARPRLTTARTASPATNKRTPALA